jgi:class 3 adenylate cyclase
MRCIRCSADSRPGARYCAACGRSLHRTCDACGRANDADARFCSDCGHALGAPADAAAAGERRHLTVLFCDVVGSTQLAARMDTEDWYAIAARYQQCGAEAVERFGGHIAQFLGDGFFTYFGYPVAYDDAPERGVRAAIAVLDAVERLNAELDAAYGVRLAVRVSDAAAATTSRCSARRCTWRRACSTWPNPVRSS